MPDPNSGLHSKQEQHMIRESQGKNTIIQDSSKNLNRSDLYDTGVRVLNKLGVKIQIAETGQFCKHDLYMKSPPETPKGMKYQPDFLPYIKVTDISKAFQIFDEFCSEANDPEVIEYWTPFWVKQNTPAPIQIFSESKLNLERQAFIGKVKRKDALELYHSFNHYYRHPLTWVPLESDFPERVRKLRFKDIFTIFPDAELQLLQLMLGRIGVGINGHNPPGTDIVVSHTFRMAGILIGREAGLGKSTLFDYFMSAIAYCGFSSSTFRDIGAQFGIKEGALSHFLYKDDTTMKSLRKILTSEDTKVLISNGLMQTEEKFQSNEEIKPRCVMIANSNTWDSNLVYELDSGTLSRVKLLSTLYRSELKDKDPHIPAIGKETADFRPHYHLGWMADELDVQIETIMLWALRLATDYFWEVITREVKPGVNSLEEEVKKWTSRSRVRFKADSTQAIMNALVMSYLIKDNNWVCPELNPDVLVDGFKNLYYIMSDLSTCHLLDLMKEDWEDDNRPTQHFYDGMRELVPATLRDSYEGYAKFVNQPDDQKSSMSDIIREIMGKITLRDGFKISPGMTYLVEFWNRSQFNIGDLRSKAATLMKKFQENHPQECKIMLANWGNPCDGWMYKENYSPVFAENLKSEAKQQDKIYLKRLKETN